MTDKLLMQKDGPIGWIVFNQPEKRNAVSLEMWEAMPEYVRELTADDAIRVVVLRGAAHLTPWDAREESIRTERCYKFSRASAQSMLGAAGLRLERWHVDSGDYFALAVVAPA